MHFYAIVDNNSEDTCLPPEYSLKIFEKFKLKSVKFNRYLDIKDPSCLLKTIKEIFKNVKYFYNNQNNHIKKKYINKDLRIINRAKRRRVSPIFCNRKSINKKITNFKFMQNQDLRVQNLQKIA